MPKKIDINNLLWKKYWRLIILWEWKKINKERYVKCSCSCGNLCEKRFSSLRKWICKSCWCLWKENLMLLWDKNKTHWMSWTHIYICWENMKWRCNTKSRIEYHRYWWRWINYDTKRECFEWFYEDMYPSYKKWYQLDRIDNNKWYSKENCRRATHKQQQNNKKYHRYITVNWITKNAQQRSEIIWLKSVWALYYQLYKWSEVEYIKNKLIWRKIKSKR
jgi:hypothetical protein